MIALPWTYLALLCTGYGLALSYGQLDWPAAASIALLIAIGVAVRQPRRQWLRTLGHGAFVVMALALALHWLPGFNSDRVIGPQRFTADAVPFSMYLNLDKPLIGFWLLLACPWIASHHRLLSSLRATLTALAFCALATLGGAWLLGIIHWAPKWPDQAWLWLANNLLLVTVVEEVLFRGYIQGGLSRRLNNLPHGQTLSLLLTALLFGAAHAGAGWQWVLLATIAGIGYGLAYRFGGLGAAIATHLGLNLLHFGLFTYPMLAG